jgi:hypothetical protein
MFRSVIAITGDDILDSFEAIAAAMYTDGIVEPKSKLKPKADDVLSPSHRKMTTKMIPIYPRRSLPHHRTVVCLKTGLLSFG